MDFTTVKMSRVKIKNVTAVRKILKGYDSWLPLKATARGKSGAGILTLPKQWEHQWPSAVTLDELEKIDPDLDFEATLNQEVDLHIKRGQRGFRDLLLQLAPYLRSPLIVQVCDFDHDWFAAKEWVVRPGARVVEIEEINTHKIMEMEEQAATRKRAK